MSTVKIATSKLTALASAVRGKSGESDVLTLNDIPAIIPSLAAPPTWANGTWEQIAQALSDHKAGKIDLYTTPGWEIGATRVVPLAAMDATGVGESHVAQDVEIVLTDKNVYDLSDGSGKCIFTWDMNGCLANGKTTEFGQMHDSLVHNGGWEVSKRRAWCNTMFYNALPTKFKALIPQVKIKASNGAKTPSIITSNDYCFLRAEIEIFGSTTYSVAGEGAQIEYYKIPDNRKKLVGVGNTNGTNWWERSAVSTTEFCWVDIAGAAAKTTGDLNRGLMVCGCI